MILTDLSNTIKNCGRKSFHKHFKSWYSERKIIWYSFSYAILLSAKNTDPIVDRKFVELHSHK